MLTVTETPLNGVLLITPPTSHEDFRGSYLEVYNEREYKAAGIDIHFVQDDVSISYCHVLRGIHGDADTWKLVHCAYGRIYQVIVNNDPTSTQYLQWTGVLLSGENYYQVLIPPNFGNAFLVLSDIAAYAYKQSSYYRGAVHQFTLNPLDPRIGIYWPINKPILSERDAHAPFLP